MEEHTLAIVDGVNKLLDKLFHVGDDFFKGHIFMAILVTGLILLFFRRATRNLNMFPGKMQQFLEMLYGAFQSIIDGEIGEEGRKFLPVIGTLGIFIAISNLIGLFPEMASPTANLNITVGCAIFIFIYYHVHGIKRHGFIGYLKTFAGPVWWLVPLFFPIEMISHFSRPLSLAMRLFGNIFGEDLVIIIIASIIPFGLIGPIPVMALAVFSSMLQAFIFITLSTIYLSGAMAEEH